MLIISLFSCDMIVRIIVEKFFNLLLHGGLFGVVVTALATWPLYHSSQYFYYVYMYCVLCKMKLYEEQLKACV